MIEWTRKEVNFMNNYHCIKNPTDYLDLVGSWVILERMNGNNQKIHVFKEKFNG
jgi:hypothetical protein